MLQGLILELSRKRAAGIEPASSAWKAEVLPLNYARTNTKEPSLRRLGLFVYAHAL